MTAAVPPLTDERRQLHKTCAFVAEWADTIHDYATDLLTRDRTEIDRDSLADMRVKDIERYLTELDAIEAGANSAVAGTSYVDSGDRLYRELVSVAADAKYLAHLIRAAVQL